jgi:YD repeat-containing protein
VDPNQISAQRGYDDFGRLGEVVDPEGRTTVTFASSPVSTLDTAAGHAEPRTEVTVEQQGTSGTPGGVVIKDYDNYGRVVRITSQGFDADVIEEQTYDARGRLHATTLPHTGASTQAANVVYAYDELNRLTQATNSDKEREAN